MEEEEDEERAEQHIFGSETGQIRFWRAQSQALSSVRFFVVLSEFRGENSVSSSQPSISVPKAEHTEFAAEPSEFSLPEQCSRKQYSAHCLLGQCHRGQRQYMDEISDRHSHVFHWAGLKEGSERGVFTSDCQYIISLRFPNSNRVAAQRRHPTPS